MFFRVKKGATVAKVKFLVKGSKLTFDEVLALYHAMLLYALDILKKEFKEWIKKYVPKRTGQLRKNMLSQLESSNVKKALMRIVLGTSIDYAPKVAAMSTSQVAHDNELGYAYYAGHSGRIMLNDPDAIGNFWEILKDFAEERIQSVLTRATNEFFAGTGSLIKGVRGTL